MGIQEGATPASSWRQMVRMDARISRWSYTKGSRNGGSLQLIISMLSKRYTAHLVSRVETAGIVAGRRPKE